MYREAPDARSRASGRAEDRRAARPCASLQGELRHVYLMPDVPPETGAGCQPDSTWETVFAHVRRLVQGQRP